MSAAECEMAKCCRWHRAELLQMRTVRFTRRATFCGIPVYLADDGEDGCVVEGTNWFFDWIIRWWPQAVMYVTNTIAPLVMTPDQFADYEPVWAFKVKEELNPPIVKQMETT